MKDYAKYSVEGLDVTAENGAGYLTLNRPEKLNAGTREMFQAMRLMMLRWDIDPEVRAIVIRSTGEEAFCTGGDVSKGGGKFLESMEEGDLAPQLATVDGGFWPFSTMERIGTMIVAAVNGRAMGSGFITALCSDLVIASENASFRVPEVLVGQADMFIPPRLYLHVGLANARWLMYTAEEIGAEEALRIGLVARVVPHEKLAEETERVVARVKRGAPSSQADYKRMLKNSLGEYRPDEFLAHMRHPEAMEGIQAFKEKRPPSWADAEGEDVREWRKD